MAEGPVRVLDLTATLGGAYCARLLAASGLDVTRAEPAGGHWLRRWSASGSTMPDGQRSVTVDPDDADDGAALLEWTAAMDAVLWSPGQGGPPLVELAPVRAAAPGGVVTAITPFGLTGPWADRPATELTLQALSGG